MASGFGNRGGLDVTNSNLDRVIQGIAARGGLSGSRAPAGTVFEDGSIAGGGVLPGSKADIGGGGFGIDFDPQSGPYGVIVW